MRMLALAFFWRVAVSEMLENRFVRPSWRSKLTTDLFGAMAVTGQWGVLAHQVQALTYRETTVRGFCCGGLVQHSEHGRLNRTYMYSSNRK